MEKNCRFPSSLANSASLSSFVDIVARVLSLAYVSFNRYVRLFAPSLQWVPWPPLAGALRFPTFLGTYGFVRLLSILPDASGLPWQSVPPMVRRR